MRESTTEGWVNFLAFEEQLYRHAENVEFGNQVVVHDFLVEVFDGIQDPEVFLTLLHLLDVGFGLVAFHVDRKREEYNDRNRNEWWLNTLNPRMGDIYASKCSTEHTDALWFAGIFFAFIFYSII